ncbi:hypothetical protein SEA_ARCHIMEDES_27 [Gordonia phage Archimedes]|uniref:DUF7233 domain-containing protein n=1 Tax=Gordonia phage Archimedes TaxID=2759389 RepID=A0A7L7SNL1_9CAUD|nr:hypothetical protein KCH38_gp27 [Gordonia phage Archimedes]QOC55727.1 hypothetical protein SEA_ARCHIMEDES_27 [Gordonia phage Archimedes]
MILIDQDIQMWLPSFQVVAVPQGTQVLAVDLDEEHWRVSMHIAYDYDPFLDADAPAFEFLADELVVDASGDYTITRDVVYLSLPGRTTMKKESSDGS